MPCCLLTELCVCGRCVDLARMSPVERRNALKHPRERFLEYAVRGEWRRHATDESGEKGTWYIGVPELVKTFGAAVVKEKLAAYAAAQAIARERAIANAVAEEEGVAPGDAQ